MNREQRRASEKEGRRLQKLDWNKFEDVTKEAKKKAELLRPDRVFDPVMVWKNNKYIVQLTGEDLMHFGVWWRKVYVRRSDSKPIYSWSDIQRVKNELFGEHVTAIQFFPPQSELVDVANMYWIWIRSEDLKNN